MKSSIAALALATAALGGIAMAAPPKPGLAGAITDPLRPAADVARDANRKPAQAVAFAQVKPGDTVAEIFPGGGYFTRILARTVGARGHVYAIVPAAFAQRPGGMDAINALAAQYPNVTVVPADLASFTLPERADVVWTSENWHDFHNGPTANPAGIAKAVYAALKPNGVFYIEDHAAAPGAGTTVTNTLHRIEASSVIAELTAAGFKLDGTGTFLANPADPHTAGVRDPSIQGKTDKFALRFRRPR